MNSKRNRMLVLLLAMILLPVISFAVNKDQFSRDHTRATTLRESKDLIGLANLSEEIQNKWSPKNKEKYGALMVHSLISWRSAYKKADKKVPMNLIRQYAAQALSTYDPNKPDNISIKTELDLVSILHEEYTYSKGKRTDQDWATARRKGAEMWFHAWRRLDNAIDEDWDPNDIPQANVSPPKGIGIPGIPGMPPEMIKDPVLRAEYERAIEKNREKIKIRNEQIKLRNVKKMYFRIVKKYLVSTYSIPPYDNTELNKLLKTGIVNDKTRKEFLKTIRKFQPEAQHIFPRQKTSAGVR